MKKIRIPPIQIWRKMIIETANRLPPKNWLAMTGSGVMNPPITFGAASIMIMTRMRIFCNPMYMT